MWSPALSGEPAATAGEGAYSAHTSTDLLFILIYSRAGVKEHEPGDLSKQQPV